MYYDAGPADEEVVVERVYGDKVVKSMTRRAYLPRDDPRYVDDSPRYQGVAVGQKLSFQSSYGRSSDQPDAEDYFKATGLRRLLLAEVAQKVMGFFTSAQRKRFLPFVSANAVERFVASIGDNYGPDVDWLPKPLQKYGKAANPTKFLSKPSDKCYVTFDASISRGKYGAMI